MADRSKIGWTEATWNPVTGCEEVSPGCDHCYAKTFAERFRGVEGHHFQNGFDVTLRPERLDQPLRWKKPRRIFVNSMSDLFHDDIPDLFIEQVFDVMEQATHHVFQVLTKRHARMRSFVRARQQRREDYARAFETHEIPERRTCPAAIAARQRADNPPPNIWLGVSVEDQKWAGIRIPALLDTPAAVRWLSAEPLLGPLDLSPWIYGKVWPNTAKGRGIGGQMFTADPSPIDWVIVGGESGRGARRMDPEWARRVLEDAAIAGVPAFFKQTGAVLAKEMGLAHSKGEDPAEWPGWMQVQEYPELEAA